MKKPKNKLQALLHAKGMTIADLAGKLPGRNYFSIHKTLVGIRSAKHIRLDIARALDLDPDQVWGIDSDRYLSRQIQKEIDRRAKSELRRLKERYLGQSDDVSRAA